MRITQKNIEQAYTDHSATYGGIKEDYFALLYLIRKFKISHEEAATQIAFGGNDYGFDGFHFDREARNLYLYQFKWSENSALFKQSLTRLIAAGMEAVFGSPADAEENPVLVQLRVTIHENKALIERVFVHFVFNGDTARAEQSAALSALREDVENKKYLMRKAPPVRSFDTAQIRDQNHRPLCQFPNYRDFRLLNRLPKPAGFLGIALAFSRPSMSASLKLHKRMFCHDPSPNSAIGGGPAFRGAEFIWLGISFSHGRWLYLRKSRASGIWYE